jgi:TRAP-type C4-dicarboxylate transport system permease small subunit
MLARSCQLLEACMAILLACMVTLVFGNAVLRYIFNSGITISEEVSRWMFIWVTFIGAVVALRERAHLGVDMVIAKLPRGLQKLCLSVCYLSMLYIFWLLYEGSLQQIQINLEVTAPVTGAPLAIVYLPCLVFALGAALVVALDLLMLWTGRTAPEALRNSQDLEDAARAATLHSDGTTDADIDSPTSTERAQKALP